MGGSDGGSSPADGGRRNLRRWATRQCVERLAGVRDPDQQARRRRLALAGGGAALTRWLADRAEDAVLLGLTAVGLALFIGPLLLGPAFPQPVVLFSALVAVSAVVVLGVALQTHRLSTRLLAVLAALVAIDATLRLVIVIGLLGFSPIFFLVIAGGFVMGPSFGFAAGALTLLLSAVVTAGPRFLTRGSRPAGSAWAPDTWGGSAARHHRRRSRCSPCMAAPPASATASSSTSGNGRCWLPPGRRRSAGHPGSASRR